MPAKEPVKLDLKHLAFPALSPKKVSPNVPFEESYTNATLAKAPLVLPLKETRSIAIGKPDEVHFEGKRYFGNPTSITQTGYWKYKPDFVNNVSNMDVDQGLSSPNINHIISDRFGNIWNTSGGLGANIFDGKYHYNLTEKTTTVANYVGAVREDKNGCMWFLQSNMTMYDGNSYYFFPLKKQFPRSDCGNLSKDRSGNLWFICTGEEPMLIRYDGKHFMRYGTAQGLPNAGIAGLYEDSKGNIWAVMAKGIARLNLNTDGTGSLALYEHSPVFEQADPRAFTEDKSGNIWMTTSKGLLRIKSDSACVYREEQGLPWNDLYALHSSSAGLWIGMGKGAAFFDGKYFYRYDAREGFSDRGAGYFYEDNKENIWCGVFSEGIYRMNSKPFVNFSNREKIAASALVSILPAKDGSLWLGSNNGKLIRKIDGKQYTYTGNDGTMGGVPRGIFQDSKGNVWFAFWGGGAMKFDGKDFYLYGKEQGLPNLNIISVNEDREGNMWFGSFDAGAICLKGDSFYQYNKEGGMPGNSCWELNNDRKGNFWIAFRRGGLVRYDGKDFFFYDKSQGLPSPNILVHYQDSKGNTWIGTDGAGASYFDGKTFRNFSTDDGLSNDKIWAIQEDLKHRIWFTTEKGLCRGEWKGDKFQIQSFDRSDGVLGLDYYNNAIAMDSSGSIYFGSGRGMVLYDSKKEPSNPPPCTVHLNDIQLAGRKVQWNHPRFVAKDYDTLWLCGKDSFLLAGKLMRDTLAEAGISYSGVSPFFNLPEKLVLSYSNNNISFSFAGQDWGDEHKLRYTCMMEGLETSWSPLSIKSEAEYRNLREGKYTFMVKAVDRYGNESTAASFSFSILPPWYRTWWFYALEALFGGFCIYMFVKYRERALKENNRRLEATVTERTREVVEQKHIVDQRNKDMTDSINYAKRIQDAVFPAKEEKYRLFPDAFVLFQPRDVVSGDFYWFGEQNGKRIMAAVDCTGHGVPGAFMSLIGNTYLNEIVYEKEITNPSEILGELRERVIQSLKQSSAADATKDGMDIALLVFDDKEGVVEFAGANNPLWVIQKENNVERQTSNVKLVEYPADKRPIGYYLGRGLPFTNHRIELKKGDAYYIFTDGFADQFGGPKGKKFKYKALEALLLSIQHLPMKEQETFLLEKFNSWKGELEQVDDVLVIGVKI